MNRVITTLLAALLMNTSFMASADELRNSGHSSVRDRDPVRYTKGLQLYQKNCAECHGRQGEGAPNWRQRDAQGRFRPPPLNGTGHTWHHPMHVLKDIIRNGTAKFGGNMPAWKGKIVEEEIDLILFWVQSQWPDEIYRRWYENDRVVRENLKRK